MRRLTWCEERCRAARVGLCACRGSVALAGVQLFCYLQTADFPVESGVPLSSSDDPTRCLMCVLVPRPHSPIRIASDAQSRGHVRYRRIRRRGPAGGCCRRSHRRGWREASGGDYGCQAAHASAGAGAGAGAGCDGRRRRLRRGPPYIETGARAKAWCLLILAGASHSIPPDTTRPTHFILPMGHLSRHDIL